MVQEKIMRAQRRRAKATNFDRSPHNPVLHSPRRNQDVQGPTGKFLVARHEKGHSRIHRQM